MSDPSQARQRPAGWRFDFAAAERAVTECEQTAQALLGVAEVIATDVPVVTEDWRGRFREVFDVESVQHHLAAQTLAQDMLAMAAGIRAQAIIAAAAWEPVEDEP